MKDRFEVSREGAVVGHITVYVYRGKTAELDDFYVTASYRDQGIGSQILREVCETADAEGITLNLGAAPDPGRREDLLRLYEAFGFRAKDRAIACPHMTRQPRQAAASTPAEARAAP